MSLIKIQDIPKRNTDSINIKYGFDNYAELKSSNFIFIVTSYEAGGQAVKGYSPSLSYNEKTGVVTVNHGTGNAYDYVGGWAQSSGTLYYIP